MEMTNLKSNMFLNDQELVDLTGYHKPAEQLKFLESLNIPAIITKAKNNKRCVVLRNSVFDYFGMRTKDYETAKAATTSPKMRLS